jgi:hypothetical protein
MLYTFLSSGFRWGYEKFIYLCAGKTTKTVKDEKIIALRIVYSGGDGGNVDMPHQSESCGYSACPHVIVCGIGHVVYAISVAAVSGEEKA